MQVLIGPLLLRVSLASVVALSLFLMGVSSSDIVAGPLGDGQWCLGNVAVTPMKEDLEIDGCQFSSDVVGKTIEILSTEPAGQRTVAIVRRRISSSRLTLNIQLAWPQLRKMRSKILFGTDDTAALQAALDRGGMTYLRSGAYYLSRNLHFASAVSQDSHPNSGIISTGMAHIHFLLGSDPRYGISSGSWEQNNAFADYGVLCKGITFDGGYNVADVMVDVSFGSIYDNCHWEGGTRYGIHISSTTEDGTPLANGRENLSFEGSDASLNGSDGLHIDAFNKTGTTDIQIHGGFWHDNNGFQLYAGESAGMQISGVHAYSGKMLPSVYFDSAGYGTIITNNYFEQDVVINSVNSASRSVVIQGNAIGGVLAVNFINTVPGAVVLSRGNSFYSGGPNNGIRQGSFLPSQLIISEGDIFRNSSPFTWAGKHPEIRNIVVRGDVIIGSKDGLSPCVIDAIAGEKSRDQSISCTP